MLFAVYYIVVDVVILENAIIRLKCGNLISLLKSGRLVDMMSISLEYVEMNDFGFIHRVKCTS